MAKNEINDWISQANEDLETAEYNLKGKKYKAAVFFCQQAAEKAIKSSPPPNRSKLRRMLAPTGARGARQGLLCATLEFMQT